MSFSLSFLFRGIEGLPTAAEESVATVAIVDGIGTIDRIADPIGIWSDRCLALDCFDISIWRGQLSAGAKGERRECDQGEH